MLEIKLHDGPARLGKWNNSITPSILSADDVNLVDHQPMAYDVPRALAEWSVEETILKAQEGNREDTAIIHGAKYLDLRLDCVRELEKLGYSNFLLANTDQLLKRPRELVKMIVTIREAINPNSSLYVPFCDLKYIPLLCYLGLDLFGDASCGYNALLGVMLTPDGNYAVDEYEIYDKENYDMDYSGLLEYNKNSMDFVIREVKAHMKNGTLRNLVEMRCASSPETMAALRILDTDHSDYVLKYSGLY
ncbi:MAG: archaeosine tRNA-ribosyltransferase [Methanobacteriaceae archaeon]|nr:archaeosine tRNA-ribosyltransferase [Methanobacteriaceae archaeon]